MMKRVPMPRRIDTLTPAKAVVFSGMLVQIGIPDTRKQKSLIEAVLEMAEREAKEIAQLRAQALNPSGNVDTADANSDAGR
jgi:hypothetical protein